MSFFPFGNLFRILVLKQPQVAKADLLKASAPPSILRRLLNYTVLCHLNHATDFFVALICYWYAFPIDSAGNWNWEWILTVFAFNFLVECILYGGWHWFLYSSPFVAKLSAVKFDPKNQYSNDGRSLLFHEVVFTTLGFFQSSLYQIIMMHLWATGKLPFYTRFWDYPVWSIAQLLLVTYWREFHFYWVHRFLHPWRFRLPLVGDAGKQLYKYVHKLHHRSHSPGPFSGLSMHPIEHFFYYTCTLLPLLFKLHPLHFLYAKFHADIAPIGGHDGYGAPAGDAGYHFLHHSLFEVNYGVPLIDFDRLFGTWLGYNTYWERQKMKSSIKTH